MTNEIPCPSDALAGNGLERDENRLDRTPASFSRTPSLAPYRSYRAPDPLTLASLLCLAGLSNEGVRIDRARLGVAVSEARQF